MTSFKYLFSLVVLSFVFAGCSTAEKREPSSTIAVSEMTPEQKKLALEELVDKEVEEIDEISQMPKSSKDLSEAEDIPHEVNDLVLKWIDYYQGRGRKYMERDLSRLARYAPVMKKILKERGLPEDLIYVAMIESGFSSGALSRVGAVGYWQFMRGTGKDFGLKINGMLDERRDPILSTHAAADYFSGLYNLFGSWYLAIASYNTGENRVKRLVMVHHTRDFWELVAKKGLPRETINYVPKYLAARLIAKHPAKFGFTNIEYQSPLVFDEIAVNGTLSLQKMANLLGTTSEELKKLNPMFKTDYAMSARGGNYILRVPQGHKEKALELVAGARVKAGAQVLAAARTGGANYVRYKVKSGDSLIGIANRSGVSLSEMAKLNNLSPRTRLMVGQFIRVPQTGSTKVSLRNQAKLELKKNARSVAAAKAAADRIHVVKRGDTLIRIAKKYRVSMNELRDLNKFSSRSRILVGDKIHIPD